MVIKRVVTNVLYLIPERSIINMWLFRILTLCRLLIKRKEVLSADFKRSCFSNPFKLNKMIIKDGAGDFTFLQFNEKV